MVSVDDGSRRVDRAVAGDAVSLGQLLTDRYEQVVLHIRSVARQLPDVGLSVDDLVQQTFVQAVRGIGGLQTRTEMGFTAWLAAIAERQTRNALRHATRQKRACPSGQVSLPNAAQNSSLISLVNLVTDPQPTPRLALSQQDAIRAVQAGIAALPDDQQRAVQLHYLEGQTLEQAATNLARSPAAVRGLLQRARKTLRAALGHSSRWFDKRS